MGDSMKQASDLQFCIRLEIDSPGRDRESAQAVLVAIPVVPELFCLRLGSRVRVRFGHSSDKGIEIVDGLMAGDKVILSDMGDYEGVSTIRL